MEFIARPLLQKNMIPYPTARMQSTTAIVYTHSLLKGDGGVCKVLEFARGLVSADCSTILDVNYTVNGSPFLQRDMHQVHSKRNRIHCIHCLVRQFNGDGFTKAFYNFDQVHVL